jgi:hypothetical protein
MMNRDGKMCVLEKDISIDSSILRRELQRARSIPNYVEHIEEQLRSGKLPMDMGPLEVRREMLVVFSAYWMKDMQGLQWDAVGVASLLIDEQPPPRMGRTQAALWVSAAMRKWKAHK